jgi:hypothetical protein
MKLRLARAEALHAHRQPMSPTAILKPPSFFANEQRSLREAVEHVSAAWSASYPRRR